MDINNINVILEGGMVQHVVSADKNLIGKTVNIIDYDVGNYDVDNVDDDDALSVVCGHEAIATAFIVGEACDDFSIE